MKPLNVLNAIAGKTLVISGALTNKVACLGSSMSANVKPNSAYVPFITLAPKEGKNGVL